MELTKKTKFIIFVILLRIFVLGVAIFGPKFVQKLQIENRELKRQMAAVITKMKEVVSKMDNEVLPMSRSQAELMLKIEKMESELRINTDKVDQNTYKLSQISQQMADVKYKTTARTPGSGSGEVAPCEDPQAVGGPCQAGVRPLS